MATKKTVKEEIKEEAKNEVPVLRGLGDDSLPPLPGSDIEYITIRGKNGIFNIRMNGLNMVVLYTDQDGVQYDCDVDLTEI